MKYILLFFFNICISFIQTALLRFHNACTSKCVFTNSLWIWCKK